MPRKAPALGHPLYLLGKRIVRARLARGINQPQLADLIGVSLGMMRMYEHGLRNPPIEALVRIADRCDTSVSALMSVLDDYDTLQLPERQVKKRKRADEP